MGLSVLCVSPPRFISHSPDQYLKRLPRTSLEARWHCTLRVSSAELFILPLLTLVIQSLEGRWKDDWCPHSATRHTRSVVLNVPSWTSSTTTVPWERLRNASSEALPKIYWGRNLRGEAQMFVVSPALHVILMITQVRTTELEQGSANGGLRAKYSPVPVYKMVLDHGCIMAFIYASFMAAFTLQQQKGAE